MKSFHHTLLVLLLGAAAALSGFPAAYGQEEEEEKEVFTLEEIVVTATKREENILEVPVTMTAFTNQLIEELGMTNSDDLEQLTPGLQFGDENMKVGQGTVIRGIGSRWWGEMSMDLAVATYVDGVYTYSDYGIAPDLFDVERVEVARGPQGTLHGRNSIAGSISVITKKPTEEWDAEVLAEFTDQFAQRYNVAFGGPITDQFLFRITGGYEDGDGAQENTGLADDYGAPHESSIAPQLRFKTDRFDINARYAYTEDTGSPRMAVLIRNPARNQPMNCWGFWGCDEGHEDSPTNVWYRYSEPLPSVEKCDPGEPGNQCEDLQNKINVNRPAVSDSTRDSFTLNADYHISESLMVRYTYGWSDIVQFASRDYDDTNRVGGWQGELWAWADPECDPEEEPDECAYITDRRLLSSDVGAPFQDWRSGWPYYNDQSSHELQIFSDFDGPINFIAGIYYYENYTNWMDVHEDFASVFRFTTADQALANAGIDWDEDGTPDFANCQEFVETMAGYWGLETAPGPGIQEWLTCAPGSDHTILGYTYSEAEIETRAVFASIDYRVNDQWFISAGLRWTEDEKLQGRTGDDWKFEVDGVPLQYSSNFASGASAKWDALIWNVAVEYTPKDATMVYGRISTGYRAGGLPAVSSEHRIPIEEETLINYEIGLKSLSMDQRLQTTAAMFYQDFDGYQIAAEMILDDQYLSPYAESPIGEYTANVDGTAIWGGEIEVTYHLGDRWRFSGYYAYLDSQIGAHASSVEGDPDVELDTWPRLDPESDPPELICTPEWIAENEEDAGECYYQVPRVHTDNKLPQQPKHKFALTAAYAMPLFDTGDLLLLGTWSYTGERQADVYNMPGLEMRAYSRVDIRGIWTSESKRWSATLYVQNLFDEIGLIEYVPEFSQDFGTLTEPRRIGLILRWKL